MILLEIPLFLYHILDVKIAKNAFFTSIFSVNLDVKIENYKL